MNNLSLFSEEAGRVLYKSYTFKKISLNVLSKLINGNHSTYSFSNGIFSVFWLIAHLRNKQLIKRDKDLF